MALALVVTFPTQLGGGGGGQRAKSAQGTIKILMESDFSSNLTPFLTNIGGISPSLGGGGSAQLWWGGGGGLEPCQKDIKLRPWVLECICT